MVELISLIIFLCSLIAIGIILFRKIPTLTQLPETAPAQFEFRSAFLGLTRKIQSLPLLKNFSIDILLQKILSKIRILTLKTDNKTSNWLQKLRARSQKKKFGENDNYWKEIRKSTKK